MPDRIYVKIAINWYNVGNLCNMTELAALFAAFGLSVGLHLVRVYYHSCRFRFEANSKTKFLNEQYSTRRRR